jgi:phospholipid/cholesterol/gamma-HCH transport system substrate-binding protein
MAERFKFRYVNELAGTLVILVAVLVSVSLFFAARSQKWFERTYELNVLLPESGSHGLRTGSEVQLLGTTVGEIRRITINPEDRMVAHLRLRADFFRFVRADSVAVIRSKFGLVAQDAFLDIARGAGAALPPKNATIPCTFEKGLAATLEASLTRLENAVLPAIEDIRSLAADFRDPTRPLQQVLDRINRISKNLETGEGIAAKLLTDKSMAVELKKTLSGVNTTLGVLNDVLGDAKSTNAQIAQILEDVGQSFADMPRLTALTEKVLDDVGVLLTDIHHTMEIFPDIFGRIDAEMKSLPGLILQTEETLREVEKLVLGMQKHWLLREYVEQPKPMSRIPSVEIGPERKLP